MLALGVCATGLLPTMDPVNCVAVEMFGMLHAMLDPLTVPTTALVTSLVVATQLLFGRTTFVRSILPASEVPAARNVALMLPLDVIVLFEQELT